MKSKNLFFAFLTLTLLYSCNKAEIKKEESLELPFQVEEIAFEATSSSNARANEGLLTIELSGTSTTSPKEMYLEDLPLTDDGKGNDAVANDGIYTSYYVVTSTDKDNAGSRVLARRGKFGCSSIYAAQPGGECEGTTCPETSFLGNDTWFCICATGCSFEITW